MASEALSTGEPIGCGGDVRFSPGDGVPPGNICFMLADDTEMIRLNSDGKIFVRGEEVDDNPEIYVHFRRWLRLAHIILPEGETSGDN